MSQRFSTADVASHNKADNLYIIVDEDVYDLTKFQDEHPGGKKSMSTFQCIQLDFPLTAYSSPACCGQGCFKTVLEISQ